jgi:chromate transporter
VVALGMLYARVAGILWLHRFIDGVAAAAIGLTIMVGIRASRRVERRLGPVTILLLLFFTVGVLRWPMVPVVICVTPASVALVWLSEARRDA